jgi:beta-1,4-mannosyl-glycoprotein beta-1,4-N-acetylglucosaminyltransferase
MKILDCFGFCGENEILEIRLETLFEYIDKFIIIEGNKFFNGVAKKKFFDIENFKKYKSKIKYFFIENFPEHNGNNWVYENFQRNQIKLGLNNLEPDDLILISDVDEIPNLENKKFMNFDSAVFLQNMYYYKFNIHLSKGLKWRNKWAGTKSCKFKFSMVEI